VLLLAKREVVVAWRRYGMLGHGLLERAIAVTRRELGALHRGRRALIDVREEREIYRLVAGGEGERRNADQRAAHRGGPEATTGLRILGAKHGSHGGVLDFRHGDGASPGNWNAQSRT
jgi:hypothetical protein